MNDLIQIYLLVTKVSLVLQIILAVTQRKSNYFLLFLVLASGELLNSTLKQMMPYQNIFYVLSSLLMLPVTLQQYWKKAAFWVITSLVLLAGVLIPFYNPILSMYVILAGFFVTSSYILYELIKTALTAYRLSFFMLILLLYMLSPVFKLFFILSGNRLSELFFFIVLYIEILFTIALIFLRDNNPRHSYHFRGRSRH